MTKPAALDAQCVDIQNDRLHKGSIKVTLHIPTERGQLLTNMLGWPTYTDPVPVAIARLNFTPQPKEEEPAQETSQHLGDQTEASAADTRPPRSLPQRIGMLCNDIRFRSFISERAECSDGWTLSADATADWVRTTCGVKSRSDILPGTKAEQAWNLIESAYLAETKI